MSRSTFHTNTIVYILRIMLAYLQNQGGRVDNPTLISTSAFGFGLSGLPCALLDGLFSPLGPYFS